MHRLLAIFLWIVTTSSVAQTITAPEKRVALVIGNGGYERVEDRLPNPPNDARAIAAKFKKLDFEVIEAIDLDYRGMRTALRQFDRALSDADAGLFFYAGHGMEYRGSNYLFPTDALLESEGDVGLGLVDVGQVLHVMETRVPTRLIFLDACRDNPLARRFRGSLGATRSTQVGTGLARIDAGLGTFIAYATAPGDLAEDGRGDNSPFSAAMLQHLDEPGLDVGLLMRKIRNTVLDTTNERQIPWNSSSLRGPFVFNPSDPNLPTTAEGTAENKNVANLSPQDTDVIGTKPTGPAAIEADLDLSLDDRRAVQEALTVLGHDTKGVDGIFGRNTRLAINGWQSSKKLSSTGYLTATQYGKLLTEAQPKLAALSAAGSRPERPSKTTPAVGTFEQLEAGPEFQDCDVCPVMVELPRGTYLMGSPADEEGRRGEETYASNRDFTQHEVTVASFAIGKYEVTVREFSACIREGECQGGYFEPQNYMPKSDWRNEHPVWGASPDIVDKYIAWVNKKAKTAAYRLPTEEEWEYAARPGTTTRYAFGDQITEEQARFPDYKVTTATVPVGSYSPNRWGLHDMHGNVTELVGGGWRIDYDQAPQRANSPQPPITVRGGGVGGYSDVRSAVRWGNAWGEVQFVGFRLAKSLQ